MVPVFSVLQVFLAFGIGKVVMKYGSNLPTHPLRIFLGGRESQNGGNEAPPFNALSLVGSKLPLATYADVRDIDDVIIHVFH